MWRNNRTKRRGFTLIELLVVIVILAMLSGIVAPKFFAQIEDSKYKTCRSKMAPIESAIETYLVNTNQLPQSLEDLVVNPGIAGWVGPYLKESQLYDPWDRPFMYNITVDGYELISYGNDGVQGGEGYGADIYNY